MVRKGKEIVLGLQLPISYIDIECFSFLADGHSSVFHLQLTSKKCRPEMPRMHAAVRCVAALDPAEVAMVSGLFSTITPFSPTHGSGSSDDFPIQCTTSMGPSPCLPGDFLFRGLVNWSLPLYRGSCRPLGGSRHYIALI